MKLGWIVFLLMSVAVLPGLEIHPDYSASLVLNYALQIRANLIEINDEVFYGIVGDFRTEFEEVRDRALAGLGKVFQDYNYIGDEGIYNLSLLEVEEQNILQIMAVRKYTANNELMLILGAMILDTQDQVYAYDLDTGETVDYPIAFTCDAAQFLGKLLGYGVFWHDGSLFSEYLEEAITPCEEPEFSARASQLTTDMAVFIEILPLIFEDFEARMVLGDHSFQLCKLNDSVFIAYLPESPQILIPVIGLGTYANQGMLPLVSALWNQETKETQFLDYVPYFDKNPSDTMRFNQAQILLRSSVELIEPIKKADQKYLARSISAEAQVAINTLRKIYQIYLHTHGSTQNLTIERALKEAALGSSTLKRWVFSVKGNPPELYQAVSTETLTRIGAGKRVWYNVKDEKFYGFGVDTFE